MKDIDNFLEGFFEEVKLTQKLRNPNYDYEYFYILDSISKIKDRKLTTKELSKHLKGINYYVDEKTIMSRLQDLINLGYVERLGYGNLSLTYEGKEYHRILTMFWKNPQYHIKDVENKIIKIKKIPSHSPFSASQELAKKTYGKILLKRYKKSINKATRLRGSKKI